jgi:hypothetical protein
MLDSDRKTVATQSKDAGRGFEYTTTYNQEVVVYIGRGFESCIAYTGTTRFKKCKQLFEYQQLLLLRDIWWSKF